jgi:hypothetical protein
MGNGSRRVRQIEIRGVESFFTEGLNGSIESLDLKIRELVLPEVVGRGEMSHDPFDAEMFERSKRFGKFGHLIVTHPDAAHAGVDLYVDGNVGPSSRGRGVEDRRLFDLEYDRRQAVTQCESLLSFPETAEAEDQFSNAGLSQLDSFFREGDSKPIDAFLFETLRALYGTVSVGVCLDDRHVFCVADKLFGGMKIRCQIVQVDLGPGRSLRYEFCHQEGRIVRFYRVEIPLSVSQQTAEKSLPLC